MIGVLILFISTVASSLLLLQERSLKLKKNFPAFVHLPPLETLDRFVLKLILIGFPLFTMGLVLGIFLAHTSWPAHWQRDPMVLFAILCWLWYAALLEFRLAFGWRGRRLAWLNICGFAVVLFTIIGVELLFHHTAHTFFASGF